MPRDISDCLVAGLVAPVRASVDMFDAVPVATVFLVDKLIDGVLIAWEAGDRRRGEEDRTAQACRVCLREED